jgi:predicted ATPase
MITRLEVDGFKSFRKLAVDLAPVTVIVGANAVGKSNLFDVLRFLSRLATGPIAEAIRDQRGYPHELMRRTPDGSHVQEIRIAVELVLPPKVTDDFSERQIEHRRVRYEVHLRWVAGDGLGRLVVSHERATPILRSQDNWRPWGEPPHPALLDELSAGKRRLSPFLSTTEEQGDGAPGKVTFQLHQDGHAGRKRPASPPGATVLSTVTTAAEFTTLFAIRNSLASLRFLQLDPARMRSPSPDFASDTLDPSGSNLATVLHRIRVETRDDASPEGVLPDIAAELSMIVSGVRRVHLTADERSRTWQLDLDQGHGASYSARVISDGTLRLLALFAMLYDPRFTGVLCMEEPENGVHPARLAKLLERIHAHVADPTTDRDRGEPLRQVLFNSHSPVVVGAARQRVAEALFADTVTAPDGARHTRIRAVGGAEQEQWVAAEADGRVSRSEVRRFLDTVGGDV